MSHGPPRARKRCTGHMRTLGGQQRGNESWMTQSGTFKTSLKIPHVHKVYCRHLGALGLNLGKLEADFAKVRTEHRPRLQETGRESPIKAAFVRLKCKGWLPRGQPLGWFKNKPWFGGHVRNEFDLNRSFKTTHSSESNQKRKRETTT